MLREFTHQHSSGTFRRVGVLIFSIVFFSLVLGVSSLYPDPVPTPAPQETGGAIHLRKLRPHRHPEGISATNLLV